MRLLAAALLLLLALPAPAVADEDVEHDFQLWTPVVLQVDLKPKVLRAWLELQPRFDDDAGRLGVLLYRPALGVYLLDTVTLWGGYAYVERLQPEYVGEHRIWEQLQLSGPLDDAKTFRLLARLRLEHRWRDRNDPVAHRVRLLLRGQLALGDPAPPSVHAVMWNEVFVGLNTERWGPQSGFDRNRTFVGLGFQLIDQLRLEPGYLLELVQRRGPRDELANHILSITLWIDL